MIHENFNLFTQEALYEEKKRLTHNTAQRWLTASKCFCFLRYAIATLILWRLAA